MKFPVLKLAACLLLAGAVPAWSQTLNWGSLIDSEIVDSTGEELDNTFLFQLGAFEEDFIPDETNIAQWADNWRVFDSTYLGSNGDGTSQFSGTKDVHDHLNSDTPPVNDYPSMFQGLKGYIWIRNTEKGEYFLASASSWSFPVLDPECCSNGELPIGWSINDVVAPVWGVLDRDGNGDAYYIQTNAVPEVQSALLAILGGGMVLMRRRRLTRA